MPIFGKNLTNWVYFIFLKFIKNALKIVFSRHFLFKMTKILRGVYSSSASQIKDNNAFVILAYATFWSWLSINPNSKCSFALFHCWDSKIVLKRKSLLSSSLKWIFNNLIVRSNLPFSIKSVALSINNFLSTSFSKVLHLGDVELR